MTQKRRVIYYLADGARPDVMQELLQQGYLPHIRDIIADGSCKTATTCFPSTTGPAYLPFLTGHFPGTLGITGIRWFDKKAFKAPQRNNTKAIRSYCGPQAALFNSDLPTDKPTLLELFGKSYNLYNMITRGVEEECDLGRKGKSLAYLRAHFFGRNHPVDLLGHKRIMDLLQKGDDFDFLFAVFPSIDWDSHYYDIRDQRTIEAYKILDDSVGELRAFLEKKGWWQQTLFLLTSDHGLTATHTHFDIADWLEDQGLRSLAHPNIWKRDPAVAVAVSGNSFASLHFLHHPGHDPLRERELRNCMQSHRLTTLLEQQAVDHILYRGRHQGEVWVHNQQGRALIQQKGGAYAYRPETADPFGLGGELVTRHHREALEATIQSGYPDSLVQTRQLFQSHRAGDMVVCARKGFDLRDRWEIPAHKGSHGSLHREHMLVPMIANRALAAHAARTADLFSTILTWMQQPLMPAQGDSLI